MEDTLKLKKKLTTTIGISREEVYVNDVGNPYLHKRHKVQVQKIDNSRIGQAIVFDQHIIDKLYIQDYLNERQHMVCDKYYILLSKSGCFASAPSSMEKIFTSNYFLQRAMPRSIVLSPPVKQLQELCGNEKEKVFYRIMTGNPKRITESEYNVIVDCAEALLQLWYVNETSPVSLFQRAFLKETS